jgi:hypothetical protein
MTDAPDDYDTWLQRSIISPEALAAALAPAELGPTFILPADLDKMVITPENFAAMIPSEADYARWLGGAPAAPPKRKPSKRVRLRRKAEHTKARVRRFRQRQQHGAVVYKCTCDEHALADYLISTGRLDPDACLIRDNVETALSEVVADLLARWRNA